SDALAGRVHFAHLLPGNRMLLVEAPEQVFQHAQVTERSLAGKLLWRVQAPWACRANRQRDGKTLIMRDGQTMDEVDAAGKRVTDYQGLLGREEEGQTFHPDHAPHALRGGRVTWRARLGNVFVEADLNAGRWV